MPRTNTGQAGAPQTLIPDIVPHLPRTVALEALYTITLLFPVTRTYTKILVNSLIASEGFDPAIGFFGTALYECDYEA
ncbi:hypothetical protein OQA88_12549 [Cercophora sp. LCS_1]